MTLEIIYIFSIIFIGLIILRSWWLIEWLFHTHNIKNKDGVYRWWLTDEDDKLMLEIPPSRLNELCDPSDSMVLVSKAANHGTGSER